jgi:hypothetical protein
MTSSMKSAVADQAFLLPLHSSTVESCTVNDPTASRRAVKMDDKGGAGMLKGVITMVLMIMTLVLMV